MSDATKPATIINFGCLVYVAISGKMYTFIALDPQEARRATAIIQKAIKEHDESRVLDPATTEDLK